MDAILWHAAILPADRGKKLVLSLKTTEKSIKQQSVTRTSQHKVSIQNKTKKSARITALF